MERGRENGARNILFKHLLHRQIFREKLLNLNISEHSNWENPTLVNNLIYKHSDEELQDFTEWLSEFVISEKFYQYANEFIDIERKLKTEPVGITRSQLVSRRYSLLDDYK